MKSKIVFVSQLEILFTSNDLAYHPGLVSPPNGVGYPFLRDSASWGYRRSIRGADIEYVS